MILEGQILLIFQLTTSRLVSSIFRMKFLCLVTNIIKTIDNKEVKDFDVKLTFQFYRFSVFIPFPLFHSFLFLSCCRSFFLFFFLSGHLKNSRHLESSSLESMHHYDHLDTSIFKMMLYCNCYCMAMMIFPIH